MRHLPHDHHDRMLKILASNGGIITLKQLRRSMEIKMGNLERILGEMENQNRIVRSIGNRGVEYISLGK